MKKIHVNRNTRDTILSKKNFIITKNDKVVDKPIKKEKQVVKKENIQENISKDLNLEKNSSNNIQEEVVAPIENNEIQIIKNSSVVKYTKNNKDVKNKIINSSKGKSSRFYFNRKKRRIPNVNDFTTSNNKKTDFVFPIKKERNEIKRTRHRKNTRVRQQVTQETIFLTGGIGDIFAVESFMSDTQRENLKNIVYATSKANAIKNLWSALPNYNPSLNHIPVWTDFSNFWCFFKKEDCIKKLENNSVDVPSVLLEAEDWSISRIFPKAHSGKVVYNNSSFIEHTLADISEFDLLDRKYITICPYSTDKRNKMRDYNAYDWAFTLEYLKVNKLMGVIINNGRDNFIPESNSLINLNNKTNILQAVEILKNGIGYLGIDSCMSILAAKKFNTYFKVKSKNKHCIENADIYFAPKTNFSFLGDL